MDGLESRWRAERSGLLQCVVAFEGSTGRVMHEKVEWDRVGAYYEYLFVLELTT